MARQLFQTPVQLVGAAALVVEEGDVELLGEERMASWRRRKHEFCFSTAELIDVGASPSSDCYRPLAGAYITNLCWTTRRH